MSQKVRVRFAPSPTGGLHLGGVRTVLYNYLFARQQGGDFILRIEDTDQGRFVPGAEQYIFDCLQWAGIEPDESPRHGGAFGPYRQSERKANYLPYAQQLIAAGQAYYAFDSSEELDAMRKAVPNFQYNIASRLQLKNSLSLPAEEVERLLASDAPRVIRIKMPAERELSFTDMIRGTVSFQTSQVDDKVLLKADGMPTYHLAVVVDDFLMEITHAFRGEEWLPSAPVHILLWEYLFGLDRMPKWAHLPLILKPDGNGKLSKRDGDRLGFPVFAMNWTDPKTGEMTGGFRELGFLPEAFINMLAMLGWNDGSEQEIFTKEELIAKFSLERVHKGGAKFDFEKAKWYNHEWIRKIAVDHLREPVRLVLATKGLAPADDHFLDQVTSLVRERCNLLSDFALQAGFFFASPVQWDLASVQPKWNDAKKMFFVEWIRQLQLIPGWEAASLEMEFKELAAVSQIKPGDLLLPFRVMLVGGKFGPGVFEISALLGRSETIHRIEEALKVFG